jgi:hypothetical protein
MEAVEVTITAVPDNMAEVVAAQPLHTVQAVVKVVKVIQAVRINIIGLVVAVVAQANPVKTIKVEWAPAARSQALV